MAFYRILSLDGGGIRGVITATILERLEKACPGFLKKFDLFAGTSTGGILALGFAYGFTPTEARELYEKHGKEVFTDTILDDVRDLGSLIGADYETGPLKKLLMNQFGLTRLRELPKRVLISTFDMDYDPEKDPRRKPDGIPFRSWKAKFFHNYPGDESDGEQLMVDVAVRTSAAPTFFPIYQGYVDGGVVATNPSVCALAQALHTKTGGQLLENVILLSVGTGLSPRYLAVEDGDWGLMQWAPHMISLMLEGNAGLADYQCRQLLGDHYQRIESLLPYSIELDGVNQMPTMLEVARNVDLSQAIAWLENFF